MKFIKPKNKKKQKGLPLGGLKPNTKVNAGNVEMNNEIFNSGFGASSSTSAVGEALNTLKSFNDKKGIIESKKNESLKESKLNEAEIKLDKNAMMAMGDTSKVNFKNIVNKANKDEADAKAAAEAEKRKAELRNKYKDVIDKIKSSEDRIETAFEELVPASGKADSLAGELVRAAMKVLYRDYNDGDLFYEGYGLETCGHAIAFICDKIPALKDNVIDIALKQLENEEYTNAITSIADYIVNYIIDNPETLETETKDMFDSNDFWVEYLQPRYEFEFAFDNEGIERHLDNGDISESDLQWYVDDILDNSYIYKGAEVDWQYGQSGIIYNLTREGYDELDDNWYRWLDDWEKDLDEEYPEEDEDDEEFDEEE